MEPAFQKILDEYNGITSEMASGGSVDIAKLGKRHAALSSVVNKIQDLGLKTKELEDNQKLLSDGDPEIKSMALDESRRLESEILSLKSAIEELLLPRDPNDDKNAI